MNWKLKALTGVAALYLLPGVIEAAGEAVQVLKNNAAGIAFYMGLAMVSISIFLYRKGGYSVRR